jgi:hypothetical protein
MVNLQVCDKCVCVALLASVCNTMYKYNNHGQIIQNLKFHIQIVTGFSVMANLQVCDKCVALLANVCNSMHKYNHSQIIQNLKFHIQIVTERFQCNCKPTSL